MISVLKNFLPIPNNDPNPFFRYVSYIDIFGIFERDPFGNWLILKRIIILVAGIPTYWRIAVANQLKVEGAEYLEKLPNQNVYFISNHQTYFADVITFYHIFCSVKWGFRNRVLPIALFAPRARTFYVAASETMKDGFLPKIFSLAGAILVERSWRAKGENVKRTLDTSAGENVAKGLKFGWVVSFPQGTTSPYAPIRKGTAHIIKDNNPIVVPVVIDGFRRAFNKSGLSYKKRNTELKVKFKEPIHFSPDATVEEITEVVKNIIEQNMPERIARWKSEAV
ncbi:phospholipid/glycerol acyltransferase [Emticicia oligotrophica DSM 17448]|uniref:Phospholipid/glycerol acyltransferase n=1 Tax=Emticicia oligotrophica (strain DSM 17448 / CIP 109782 / MTCC 6937 / GPTSA100-15) TaxID=929562 RepID=A0ABM5N6I3_EMTOG|nr:MULTISPECIES: lysophospholipid acyltransferase family protein [Emticicia]AFK05092.1 phospholipid/glycerol acyltransferase [Emticicia oligotrophica DSM 17448]